MVRAVPHARAAAVADAGALRRAGAAGRGDHDRQRREGGSFALANGVRYALASDPDGATARAYGVPALPTVFVVDKRGVVRDLAIGFDEDREAQIEALVAKLLAEPAPAE